MKELHSNHRHRMSLRRRFLRWLEYRRFKRWLQPQAEEATREAYREAGRAIARGIMEDVKANLVINEFGTMVATSVLKSLNNEIERQMLSVDTQNPQEQEQLGEK